IEVAERLVAARDEPKLCFLGGVVVALGVEPARRVRDELRIFVGPLAVVAEKRSGGDDRVGVGLAFLDRVVEGLAGFRFGALSGIGIPELRERGVQFARRRRR